jgi:nucleoside-diphosphate-sugar epimerase
MSVAQRVVVTGGSGYIGRVLIRELLARGYDVTNLDRRPPHSPGGRFVYADLRERHQVQPTFEGADAVVHLGEIPNIHRSLPHEEVYGHNSTIASVVLQTAADLGIPKFIYTSTCQVYGIWGSNSDADAPAPQKYPMDETQPVCPHNAYSAAKVGAEFYAAALAVQHPGWSVTVLRFPWVARDSDEWIAAIARRTPGESDRLSEMGGYVHIDDAVAGYIAALNHARPGYACYHMLARDIRSLGPVRDVLARQHPHWPALPADWPDTAVPVSCERAKRELGWEPRWSLHEQIAKYRREHGL